jgi:hypothetical protein
VKLIKTISLEFRQGKSDKVYEVDLCEVGPDRFVVSFRYGRRGARLNEGSKTPMPVSRAKAEEIYNDLVAEKQAKGYHQPGAPAPPPPAPKPKSAGAAIDEAARREQAILERLRGGGGRSPWKLARVIWRAGELRLRAAEPLIWPFLSGQERPKATQPPPPPTGAASWFLRIFAGPGIQPTSTPAPSSSPRPWSRAGRRAQDDPMILAYSAAWALGRCGSTESLPRLRALVEDPATPAAVRRIALESIRNLLTPAERAEAVRRIIEGLPADLAEAVRLGSAEEILDRLRAAADEADEAALEALLPKLPNMVNTRWTPPSLVEQYVARLASNAEFRARVRARIAQGEASGHRYLIDLYRIDDGRARDAVLAFLRTAPLGPESFRHVRYVLKAAELRDDAEVIGLLTYRFETSPPPDMTDSYSLFPFSLRSHDEYPLVPRSYTAATRAYLRRRAWRGLDRLGRLGSPEYVTRAEQVLRHFRDDDARPVIPGASRKHGWGSTGKATIDRFGRYYVLGRILYRNSPRYAMARSGFLVCMGGYKPGDPVLPLREEAYPELWDRAPEVLLRLLRESRCAPVHEFAARALGANREFCRGLDLDTVAELAGIPYEATARLALALIVERFDPSRPDPRLVLLLADSPLADARAQARQWAERHWGTLRRDVELIVRLATSPHADTRAFARDLLRQTSFPEAEAKPLVARFVAWLLALGEDQGARAADVAETLLAAFRPVLRRVGEPVIRDLLAHPLPELRRFAGDLVLGHDEFGRRPPPDILRALIASPYPKVRAVGVQIFDQLDEATLKQGLDVLVGLLRHPLADLRENIRATVRRLAQGDVQFGRAVAGRLVEALLVPGAPEGVPSFTALVIREDLHPFLDRIPAETVVRLLTSRSKPAQEIGGLLLPTNVDPDTLTVEQLVKLADSDVVSVREAAWRICREHPERVAADLTTAYRLADSKWEDSRRFAFGLLRDGLGDAEWPAEALVGLCDSVKPDVQLFGREMITRQFRDEHGEHYALTLSEHPDASMQAFAGHFLDLFAADDPADVRRLRFYCAAVLSRVNRGRVAKERVFAFLERAAGSGEQAANAVAEVLARQSATAAIGDRARFLELMTWIHSAYPGIAQPIRVRPAEVRDGV